MEYCGLCNGWLRGAPCHQHLIEAEEEVRALRKLTTSAVPLIEYLAADCISPHEATNERVYMQGIARAWLREVKGD